MSAAGRSSITRMADALSAVTRHTGHDRPAGDSCSRIGVMRLALASGPKNARELAAAAGVVPSLVVPLLKGDLASGRVLRMPSAAGQMYELSAEWDGELQQRLRQARALLTRHGFEVTP